MIRLKKPWVCFTEARVDVAILETGLTDYIVLQLPTGDMTFDEARRSLELFISDVKPQLEQASPAI